MRKVFPVMLIALLMLTTGAKAWWGSGHKAVARIAWENMTPEARARAMQLIKEHPQYKDLLIDKDVKDPADGDKASFELGATWADMIKSPVGKNRLYNHSNWHYADIPYVPVPLPAGTPEPAMPSDAWKPGDVPTNLFQAMKKCTADLEDPKSSEETKAIALTWMLHLVGDVHQPLHTAGMFTADLPKGDQGGNARMVNGNHSVTNLHSFWDGILGNAESAAIIDQQAKTLMEEFPRSEFTEQLKVTEPMGWVKESYEVAVEVVYAKGKLPNVSKEAMNADKTKPVPELPQEYMDAYKVTARKRVALAGYRLANYLNEMFKGGPVAVPMTEPASEPATERAGIPVPQN